MSSHVRTDAEIIAASLTDPDAFAAIFERHHRQVFAMVGRRVGRGDAPDIVSEVFLRAFRIRHRFDSSRGGFDSSRGDCRSWLYGIAVNVVGDELRKLRRRERQYIGMRASDAGLPDIEDADQRTDAQSLSPEINRALGLLSRRDRDTFLLYVLDELTYVQISEILQIPTGTVGSRINRSRRRLAEEIPEFKQTLTGEVGDE